MTEREHLYERAAVDIGGLRPLWHIDKGRALFAGPLGRNARHRHSAPVYLAGLYGTFRLRLEAEWLTCRTAVIPAGVPYEFDMGGNPLAVLYVEPNVAGVDALAPLLRNTREVNGALIGSTGEVALLRELYEDRSSPQWAGAALHDIVAFSKRRGARQINPRVSRIVEAMYERYDELTPVAELARSVGLSASRFQHLFTQEVGVPFRRYRAWHRLRAAIREIINGSNFTAAAHAAGFFDQAHFARDFRRTFGAPASLSLSRVRC
jgi:AraC-like DNA-binding protein